MRPPGRDPALVALLAGLTPAVVERVRWSGTMHLELAAYTRWQPLPPHLVTSVRCIVRVGDRIVLCETPDGRHIWPGGRREPGETAGTTARREVREETGWLVDEADLEPLGFLHYRHLEPQPDDHPYPHPDFLQPVYTAAASRHATADPAAWVDVEGWEHSHRLLTVDQLGGLELPAAQRAFLALLPVA